MSGWDSLLPLQTPKQPMYNYTENEHQRILRPLRDAMRRFNIDSDRIFVAGHFMGADAAWDLALAHPDMWAGAIIIGGAAERLPNTLFMAVEGWDSPQQLITLDLVGVMVSAGSACSSGKVKASHVLAAMGALTGGNVRISLPFGVTDETVDGFIEAMPRVVSDVRAMLHADDLGSHARDVEGPA